MARELATERPALAGIGRAALVGVFFCAVAYLSIELSRHGGRVAAVWPANAVLVALLLRSSPKSWPAYLVASYIGNYAANFIAGDRNLTALALGLCNTVEIAVSVYAFRQSFSFTPISISSEIAKPRFLIGLGAIAGVLGPAISASMAAAILNATSAAPLLSVWPVWFMADALGMMIVAPLLIALDWKATQELFADRDSATTTLTTLGVVAAVTFVVFWQSAYPLLFLVFAAMVLPIFRLGFSGSTLACFAVATIAILLTTGDHGPLTLIKDDDVRERIFFLQAFILSVSITSLPTAAAIQARRVAEQRLAEALNLKQAIFDSTDYSIIATTRDGLITHFNHGAERILGYSKDEMVGKQTPAVIHLGSEVGERATELSAELGRPVEPGFETFIAKADEGADEREWTYVRKDGAHVPVRLSVTALKDSSGRIEGYLGVAKSLIEQRAMSAQLEQSRRDLRHIIDGIPAMVAYWDADLRNRFANRAYIDWFGWSPEDLHGKHIRDLLGPELFERNRSFMEAALRGEAQTFERELIATDGRRRFSQAHYVPDFLDGKPTGFYVLVFDISELKRSEAALKQAIEVAEKATEAKSAFLASMSHEIRTPMNAIIGMIQLLRATTLTDRQEDYVNKANTSARALLAILNDILDFSKVEAGKLALDLQPISLDKLLRETGTVLAANLGSKDVELLFDIDHSLPPWIRGDHLRLQQVLINLAGNAIKFTEKGEVVLSARRSPPGVEPPRLIIAVRDTGIGIAADRVKEIFDAFSQAEASTTRRFGGTGLGLAICQRLVALMGGSIEVRSTPGLGSTFSFDIPLEPADGPPIKHAKLQPDCSQ